MKILVTSDWQCSVRNLPECEQVLVQILKIVRRERVDHVLHLGDLKDAFNPVDQRVTNFLVRAAEGIVACCSSMLVLLGNHDRLGVADTTFSCLPVLAAAGALTVDTPTVHCLEEGIFIYMVPFMRDPEEQRKALADVDVGHPYKLLLLGFHAELQGSMFSTQYKTRSPGAVSPDMLSSYDLCIGGHVHYQQQLRSNVWYAGSPFCQDWGEANQAKGFLLIELDSAKRTCKVKRIASVVPGMYDPALPGFKVPKQWKGAKVRIKVEVRKDAIAEVTAARKRAAAKYPGAMVQVVPVFQKQAVQVPNLYGKESDVVLVRKYLERNPPSHPAPKMVAYLRTRIAGAGTFGVQHLCMTKVLAENVLSFERAALDLDVPGLTLVTGQNKDWAGRSNGSGKTNLLSLPGIALFGTTPKGQEHNSWHRQGCNKTGSVTLFLQVGVGQRMVILRTRKPGRLRFTVDDRDMTMGAVRDTQRSIESITGLTWGVLVNSLYISQHEIATVLTGTEKERKELFSRFLGLERFLVAQDAVRADMRKCNCEIMDADTALRECQIHASGAKSAAANLKSGLRPVPKKKLLALRSGVRSIERRLSALAEKKQKDVAKEQQLYKRHCAALEEKRQADTKQDVAAMRLKELLSLQSARVCPTCGSVITRENARAHVVKAKRIFAAAADVAREWAGRVDKTAWVYQKQQQVVVSLGDDYERDMQQLLKVQPLLAHMEEALKAEQERRKLIAGYETKEREWNYKAKLQKDGIKALRENLSFLEACFAVVSREGLPAFLCAMVCPALNLAAERYSQTFSEGELAVQFVVSGSDLDVQIVNTHGGAGVVDQSEGEMRLAGLIAALAFREVLLPCNILVLDEPGEGLDSHNAEMFAQGMNAVVDRFGSVFITTHNPFILSALKPDRHLEVVKQNKISSVREVL